MFKLPASAVTSTVLSLALVACGGGGADNAGVISRPADPVDNRVTHLSVVIPASTYATDSAELGGWTVLQTARVLCGFGALTQNPKLDAAALAHAKYLTFESLRTGTSLLTHEELTPLSINPNFTGDMPWDRTVAQGYGQAVAEILASTVWDYDASSPPEFPTLEQRGGSAMRSLLNTVYHLTGAMYDGADVGFGADLQTASSGTARREEFRFDSLNGYQNTVLALGKGTVTNDNYPLATYPCEGSSNVPTGFAPADEAPNPFPLLTNPTQLKGPPIYLRVDHGKRLTLSSYRIASGSAVVPASVLTQTNDPNTTNSNLPYIGRNEVFVVPDSPLAPNTSYQVLLSGSISSTFSSTPFTRNFTMTTGL